MSELSREELEANLQTWEHIDVIRRMLRMFAVRLIHRGETHDRSKLHPPESDMFAVFTKRLKGMTYGSDEYKECLKEMGQGEGPLRHHYDHNRHHPEHFKEGLKGMTLVDLVEMWIDWWASVQRHDDGDMMKSIEINKERFDMPDELVAIFENTVNAFPKRINIEPTQRTNDPNVL